MADDAFPEIPRAPVFTPEVRIRRLVVVDEAGHEQATLDVDDGVVQLRLGGSQSAVPCAVVLYDGEDEPGTFAAGVELWAKGDSVAGSSVTVAGSQADVHRFGG